MKHYLTANQLLRIEATYAGRPAGDLVAEDVAALSRHIALLEDRLTDAWLVLDAIARGSADPATEAAELLRAQAAPGWKGGGR